MALGIFAVFDPDVRTEQHQSDGVAALLALDDLDRIASRLGLRPLSSFTDRRELPDDFPGDPEEAFDVLGPRSDWHPIGEGLRTVTALAEHVEARRSPRLRRTKGVLGDLRSLQKCLTVAKRKARRFRLEAG